MKKVLPTLMLLLLIAHKTGAQNKSCATSQNLSFPFSAFSASATTSTGELWYTIQLDTGLFVLNIKNLNSSANIYAADVYDGSCTTLNYLGTDSLINSADSSLNVTIRNAVALNTYYIKLKTSVSDNYFAVSAACNVQIVGGFGFCPGELITLTAIPINPVYPVTFSWLPGGSNAASVVFAPGGNTTYTLNYTSVGCSLIKRPSVIELPPTACPSCNYVKNPSFEIIDGYGTGYSPTAASFSLANGWFSANLSTPDSYNALYNPTGAGVPFNTPSYTVATPAISGQGYAGLLTLYPSTPNYREYIESKLKCPLAIGQQYNVEFKTRLSQSSRATDKLGMALSPTAINAFTQSTLAITPIYEHPTIINYTPSWITLSTTVIGNNENYILIGLFKNDANTSVAFSTSPDAYVNNGGAYYFIDDVNVTPACTLTASDYTVSPCTSSLITLTAQGASSLYTSWTDGMSVYTGSTVTIPVPSVATTYSCTINLPCMGSCSIKTITVYVQDLQNDLDITYFPSQVCYGQYITVFANMPGATGYTWYPGPYVSDNTIYFPPLGTSVYTVAAQYGTCTVTKTLSITPYVVPPNFTTTLTSQFVCPEANSVTLTVAGASDPVLTPPAPASPTVINNGPIVLSPSVTTSYTLSAYTGQGCLTYSIITITMVPCACLNAPGNELSGNVAGIALNPNVAYKVVSNVTITPNFTAVNNDIVVYPGVKIDIINNSYGTVTIAGTHIHGCGEMWEGITLPNIKTQLNLIPTTGVITPAKTTLIEDARVAVTVLNLPPNMQSTVTPAYILNVDNATFNKNLTSIKIAPFQSTLATYPFRIQNSLFTSRAITYTVNSWPSTNTIKNSASGNISSLQTPYIDNATYPPSPISTVLYNFSGYPEYGLVLDNVGLTTMSPINYYGISIGQTGSSSFNCFDHLREDINCLNSNLFVINTVFQNGERYGANNLQGGKAIYGFSVDDLVNNINNRNVIRVSGSGVTGSYACRFYEKTYALDLENYFDITVQNNDIYSYVNDFSNFAETNAFGGRGINIKTNRYYYMLLEKNNFYNIRAAMMIGLDNAVVMIGGAVNQTVREIGVIDVNNNTVNRYLGSIPAGANPYVTLGLVVQDPVSVPTLTYSNYPGALNTTAMSNTFSGVWNGIVFNSLGNTPVSSLNNVVSMINAPNNSYQYGIQSLGLKKQVFHHSNTISGPASYNPNMYGLYSAYAASLSVRCNTTSSAGRGIVFNALNLTDFLEDNLMSNEDLGLVLDYGAVLCSPNTMLGSVTRPTDNQWLNSWNTPKFKTATYNGSDAQNSKLFVQYSSPFDPNGSADTHLSPNLNDYFHAIGNPNTLLQSVPSTSGCRLGGGGIGGGIPAGRMQLQAAVSDSLHHGTADSTEYRIVNKAFAYHVLRGEPSLIGTSSVLQDFYDTAYAGNPQLMMSIEEQLANGGLSVAGPLFSSFSPANNMEQNYKSYYGVLMSTKDGSYSTADSTSLDSLAHLCPFTDGTVVYQARALYNILYNDYFYFEDNCSGTGARMAYNPEDARRISEPKALFRTVLYPNPNNGNYILKIKQEAGKQTIGITVFDVTGKLVVQERYTVEAGAELNINSKLDNGVYLVKIKLQDGTQDIHRLVISK